MPQSFSPAELQPRGILLQASGLTPRPGSDSSPHPDRGTAEAPSSLAPIMRAKLCPLETLVAPPTPALTGAWRNYSPHDAAGDPKFTSSAWDACAVNKIAEAHLQALRQLIRDT
ncbi:hypothetical protein J1605_000804 [Eschrichtius robustus]|uniref:Uncharacterized protein n=1 Tax=Eschrichtius robustus TaxID=9764 RepID=A0AB34GKE2_ESCRO|nr:hypothetical protein J1605_000804 [Eschrichtius robustus]